MVKEIGREKTRVNTEAQPETGWNWWRGTLFGEPYFSFMECFWKSHTSSGSTLHGDDQSRPIACFSPSGDV